nr:hypothetical protein [Armatimonas sp.]
MGNQALGLTAGGDHLPGELAQVGQLGGSGFEDTPYAPRMIRHALHLTHQGLVEPGGTHLACGTRRSTGAVALVVVITHSLALAPVGGHIPATGAADPAREEVGEGVWSLGSLLSRVAALLSSAAPGKENLRLVVDITGDYRGAEALVGDLSPDKAPGADRIGKNLPGAFIGPVLPRGLSEPIADGSNGVGGDELSEDFAHQLNLLRLGYEALGSLLAGCLVALVLDGLVAKGDTGPTWPQPEAHHLRQLGASLLGDNTRPEPIGGDHHGLVRVARKS